MALCADHPEVSGNVREIDSNDFGGQLSAAGVAGG